MNSNVFEKPYYHVLVERRRVNKMVTNFGVKNGVELSRA